MSNSNKSTTMQCSACGKSKKINQYYYSSSPIHKYYEKLPVCKDCVFSMVDEKDRRSVISILRMLDKPFYEHLWDSSVEEANKQNRSVFRTYIKNVVMRQHRNANWEDSELYSEYEKQEYVHVTDVDSEVLSRWRGWDEEKIESLEHYYQDMIAAYEHKTPIQKNIYKNIAVAQMQADEAIANGKTADYQKLMKVISDLMNDAKIKPLQETGMDDSGLNTWGEWIKKIEETEPIPEPSEEFKDVDRIQNYVDKWFVKHMKKVLGLDSSIESDILKDGEK